MLMPFLFSNNFEVGCACPGNTADFKLARKTYNIPEKERTYER